MATPSFHRPLRRIHSKACQKQVPLGMLQVRVPLGTHKVQVPLGTKWVRVPLGTQKVPVPFGTQPGPQQCKWRMTLKGQSPLQTMTRKSHSQLQLTHRR